MIRLEVLFVYSPEASCIQGSGIGIWLVHPAQNALEAVGTLSFLLPCAIPVAISFFVWPLLLLHLPSVFIVLSVAICEHHPTPQEFATIQQLVAPIIRLNAQNTPPPRLR